MAVCWPLNRWQPSSRCKPEAGFACGGLLLATEVQPVPPSRPSYSERMTGSSHQAAKPPSARVPPALWVWLAGVMAALHIAKLPPAIPVLQEALGITWLEAGFLLSTVQVAGMGTGALLGVWIPSLGLRRSLILGQCLMGIGGLLGGLSNSASLLLAFRALEGAGVLLTVLPAPALIRRLVPPQSLAVWLGGWGAYMPVGAALAMVLGPWWLAAWGWSSWWHGLAVFALMLAAWCAVVVPADPVPFSLKPEASIPTGSTGSSPVHTMWRDLAQTLRAPGPWWVALCFALYSSQWLAVVGFLPTVYGLAGISAVQAGWMTAWVTLSNAFGNLSAGRLLARGVPPAMLLTVAFVTMGSMSVLAYADFTQPWPWARFVAVWLFSAVGGLLPGTLFSLTVRVAPTERTVSTTVGWVQQCSATGQFAGPPVVAWLAAQAGGWQFTWVATGSASVLGLVLVGLLHHEIHRKR